MGEHSSVVSGEDVDRFRLALSRAPIILFAQDRDLRYTWIFNPAFGTAEEIVGKTDADLFSPSTAAVLMEIMADVLCTGRGVRQEVRLETPIGVKHYDLTVEPTRDAEGRVTGVAGTALDVTERFEAERQRIEAQQRLHALLQAVPVGVSFSEDPTCQRITGNPALLAQFAAAPADNLSASAPNETASGRQIRYFLAGREVCDTELPLQRAVAENRAIPPMELEVVLPDGRRWTEVIPV